MGRIKNLLGEAKGIMLPNSKTEFMGFGRDGGGNTLAKFKNKVGKSFSIQTNGNLPKFHSLRGSKLKEIDSSELDSLSKELKDYVDKNGSASMKEGINEESKGQYYGTEEKGSKLVKISDKIGKEVSKRKAVKSSEEIKDYTKIFWVPPEYEKAKEGKSRIEGGDVKPIWTWNTGPTNRELSFKGVTK